MNEKSDSASLALATVAILGQAPSIKPFPSPLIRRLTLSLLLCVIGIVTGHGIAQAEPLEDALVASQRGDFAEAYCLWRPLAEQGDVEAQYHLAWLYANGQGLRQNPTTAADWWQQAADQGHIDAQAALGDAYRRGKGRDKNETLAVRWLMSAARGGNDEAQARLQAMAGKGNKTILAAIEKRITDQDWKSFGPPRPIKSDTANLRARPSTSAKKIGKLNKGDPVVVLLRRGDWLRIAVMPQGQLAWIYHKLVAAEEL